MKILLIGEYSGLQTELKKGLVRLGHEVTLAAGGDFWKKIPADIDLASSDHRYVYKLEQLIKPIINIRQFTGYDVVHLVNFYTIPRLSWANRLFVRFLKNNNGCITMAAAGDDPFYVRHSEEVLRYSPIPSHEKYDRRRRYYMRDVRHYKDLNGALKSVDRVIPIMYEYAACYHKAGWGGKATAPIPIPIDSSRIEEIQNNAGERLIVFHGLNRPGFKGTHLIEEAFKRVSRKRPESIECMIAGRLPLSEYRKVMAKTNVVVDQVYSYSLGMNALYAMAMGKLVLGGNEPESRVIYEGEVPPVINITPSVDKIESALEGVLQRRSELGELADRSREFVIRHHDSLMVAKKYEDIWAAL